MTEKTNIPQGYKDSPLGIIPKEWEVKRLGEICTFHNGRAYSQKELLPYGKYRVLRVGNFFTNSSWYYSNLELEDTKYANNGDLLYAWSASFGPRFWKGERIIYHYHIWKIDNFINISNTYLYMFLLFDASKLQKTLQGGTMVHVTKENMEKRYIGIPPICEQQHIVSALQHWDTAIEKQSELIEKLKLRKRALMQQLLTGKKRLPGFRGEWKRISLKSIATEVSIKNKEDKDYTVLSCTKHDGLVPSLEYFGKQIYSNDLGNYKIVPMHHFAYATNHIEEGSIGYQSKYEYGLISPMYTVFKTAKDVIDDNFLFAVLKSHHLIYLYQSMMEGSINRRGGLRWDSFSTIKIDLPPLNEQKAISSFLKDADKEIELANEKLASMQSQKRGLMQQLLTGKKRIIHK